MSFKFFFHHIYVWSKVVCFVCQAEISQITAFQVALLVFLESSVWIRVHQLGLGLFGAMVWKLLIIESFSQWKLNSNWKLYWNLGVFLAWLENSWWDRFNRFFFTIFRVKVWKRMIFWVNFVVGNSDNLQKLGPEGKISWALNVFTLGPTTQATLISMDWKLTFWVLIMFNTWQQQ